MATICSVEFSGGGIRNGDVAAGAAVAAAKIIQHYNVGHLLTATQTTSIAAIEYPFHIVGVTSAEIMRVEAAIFTLPTGDRTYTVDLFKSTGGGAFATVLSDPIEFSTSTAVRVPLVAVINDESLIEGDILKWQVTLGGASGTHAQGLLCNLTLEDRLA